MDNSKWALSVDGVSHSFGKQNILFDINFQIKPGQIVAVVGKSGSGKSTLLRSILGTHPPTTGTIYANGKLITEPSRNIGIVYQKYSLYEFLNVRKNVAFGPMVDQTTLTFRWFRPFAWRKIRKNHFKQAEQMLGKVELEGCYDLYPKELSGGMQQRVAIARALIMQPSVLLLDEPFGALDEATRERLQLVLLNLYSENLEAKKNGLRPPHTILIVTHELDEALYISDRIMGLSQYHEDGDKGATIVYDQPSPVFKPNDPKDFARFSKQKNDLRRLVFSQDRIKRTERLIAKWTDASNDTLPGNDPNFSKDRI